MTGFELQTSGIGSDRSANWVTTTALAKYVCKAVKVEVSWKSFNWKCQPRRLRHDDHLFPVINDKVPVWPDMSKFRHFGHF